MICTCINKLYACDNELCEAWNTCNENVPEKSVLKARITKFYPKSLGTLLNNIGRNFHKWGDNVRKRRFWHQREVPLVIELMRNVTVENMCSLKTIPEILLLCSVYVEEINVVNELPLYKEYKVAFLKT